MSVESQDRTGSSWNPSAWHWEEKNYSSWAEGRLAELFKNLALGEDQDLSLEITDLSKFEGDVFVNIRKGKKVPGWDFSLKLDYKGKSGESEVSGSIKVSEISADETQYEYEFTCSSKEEALVKKVKSFLKKEAPKVIGAKITEFGQEVRSK
jgi:activator of HSP90 ATPase